MKDAVIEDIREANIETREDGIEERVDYLIRNSHLHSNELFYFVSKTAAKMENETI